MNETEKQIAALEKKVCVLADCLSARLDRQGRVLDRLVAIQEDRNQHQDAMEHIQRQQTQQLKGLDERLQSVNAAFGHRLFTCREMADSAAHQLVDLEDRVETLEGDIATEPVQGT